MADGPEVPASAVDSESSTPDEISIQEALAYAIRLHLDNALDGAETLYRRILAAAPDYPDALNYFGILAYQRGRVDEGIQAIARAISLVPDFADFHINFGNMMSGTGRIDEALAAYRRADGLAPNDANIYNNVGAIHMACGAMAESEFALQRAIELDPTHFRAYNNLGRLRSRQGRDEEAVEALCTSITLMPKNPESRRLLATAYYTMGKRTEAAAVFKQWLDEEPDDPTARHMYAACSGEDVPLRADDSYIEQTFDHFASSFDEQLQVKLHYRAPELVTEALLRHALPEDRPLVILDAGCGTGLCGPLVAARAERLVGVDLSGAMLAKAEGRGGYHQLVKAELTAFMDAATAEYDVILSADTLVYFGALEPALGAARTALREQGLLAFTVEQHPVTQHPDDQPADYRMNPHGRYSHSREYIERVLADSGFDVLDLTSAVLRREAGVPVNGLVVVARTA